jgi:hypothetical protein
LIPLAIYEPMADSRWKTGFLKTCAATLIYGVVHSLFASLSAKRTAVRIAGERTRNALYRPFYLVQSAVTMAVLIAYIRRQPTRALYDCRGIAALPFRAVQIAGLCWATAAAYEVGLLEILGQTGSLSPLERR